MKRKEFLNQIKGMPKADLEAKSRTIAEELMRLRFKRSTGQLEQAHRIKELKRNLARVQTELSAQNSQVK